MNIKPINLKKEIRTCNYFFLNQGYAEIIIYIVLRKYVLMNGTVFPVNDEAHGPLVCSIVELRCMQILV